MHGSIEALCVSFVLVNCRENLRHATLCPSLQNGSVDLGPRNKPSETLLVVYKVTNLNFITAALLQVHDELVFEVAKAVLPEAAAIIRRCMEGAMHLHVPTPVKMHMGRSWGELSDYIA